MLGIPGIGRQSAVIISRIKCYLRFVSSIFLTMMLILVNSAPVGYAAYPNSYILGVKARDWVKYSYSSERNTVDVFSKVTVVSVEGPPRTSVTMQKKYYVNWPNYNDETSSGDFPIVQRDYSNWVIGMLIPANSAVGDTIITGAPGNLDRNHDGTTVILEESTGNYAGVTRSVLRVEYSVCHTLFELYYDKQTGFLLQETRTTYLLGTETVRAIQTNLWKSDIAKSSKWAVVIGIEEYDSGFLDNRLGSGNSAREMYDVLTKDFGFPEDHVNNDKGALVDRILNSNDDITSAKVKDELKWLDKVAGPEDTIVFYYAGHGAGSMNPYYTGPECLVAHDTTNQIPEEELAATLNNIQCGTQIVILDMSYAGGFIRDKYDIWWTSLALDSSGKPADNRIVLASCGIVKSPDEDTKAWYASEMAFTHFFLEGFRNDENLDGKVSVEEAFRYAARQFPTTELLVVPLLQKPMIYDGFPTFADNGDECILGSVLQRQEPSIPITIFLVQCPVQLNVYNSEGKHVGLDSFGTLEIGFEAEFQTVGDSQLVVVPNPSGTYTARLIGIGEGDYNLTISRIESGKIQESNSFAGPIIPGQTVEYQITYQGSGLLGVPWLTLPILGASIVIGLLSVVIALVMIRKLRLRKKTSILQDNSAKHAMHRIQTA